MFTQHLRSTVMALLLLLAGYQAASAIEASTVETAAIDAGREETSSGFGEYAVKAALLYHFARYTEWPGDTFAGDAAQLRICVLGSDPFAADLAGLDGKRIRGRPITSIRLTRIDGAKRCQVLFISGSEAERLASILDDLGDRPILTIADMAGFAEAGGIITLKLVNRQVRFEINVQAARRNGLKLSAKLLSLAEIYAAAASHTDGGE